MGVVEVANGDLLYALAIVVVAFVIIQAPAFLIKAWKEAKHKIKK